MNKLSTGVNSSQALFCVLILVSVYNNLCTWITSAGILVQLMSASLRNDVFLPSWLPLEVILRTRFFKSTSIIFYDPLQKLFSPILKSTVILSSLDPIGCYNRLTSLLLSYSKIESSRLVWTSDYTTNSEGSGRYLSFEGFLYILPN